MQISPKGKSCRREKSARLICAARLPHLRDIQTNISSDYINERPPSDVWTDPTGYFPKENFRSLSMKLPKERYRAAE